MEQAKNKTHHEDDFSKKAETALVDRPRVKIKPLLSKSKSHNAEQLKGGLMIVKKPKYAPSMFGFDDFISADGEVRLNFKQAMQQKEESEDFQEGLVPGMNMLSMFSPIQKMPQRKRRGSLVVGIPKD